jgi:hypothetical protein
MGRRFTVVITAAVLALAGGAAFAIAQEVLGTAAQDQQAAAQQQYSGKACGSPTRPQGVPPGNPSNNECPPQASQRGRPRRLSSKVRSRRTNRGMLLVTSGRLQLPEGITAATGCSAGRVQVQIKSGARTVSTRRVNLRKNCTYRSRANISGRRLGTRRLVIIAQFLGNDFLSAKRAQRKTVSPK